MNYSLSFDEYESAAAETAVYPDRGNNLNYPVLGLAGEAGEVAGKLSKVWRDKGGQVDDEMRAKLIDEAGDVLWFLSSVCHELGTSLEEVAQANLYKLRDRKDRGVIQGDGDQR